MKSSKLKSRWRRAAGPVALGQNPKAVETHRPRNTIADPTEGVVVAVVVVVLEAAAVEMGSRGSSNGNSTRSPPNQRPSSLPIRQPLSPASAGTTLGQ